MADNHNLVLSIADIMYHLAMATRYGGDLFEYFDDYGIEEYDLYLEDDAIDYIPSIANTAKRMPDKVFGNVESDLTTRISFERAHNIVVYPISKVTNNEKPKVIVVCCRWEWNLWRFLQNNNYQVVTLNALVDYTLFKSVVMKSCAGYVSEIGAKSLFTKYPRTDLITNRSPVEKYIADHQIYGYSGAYDEEFIKLGHDLGTVCKGVGGSGVFVNGVYRYADNTSEKMNFINGHRVTTDVPLNTKHTVWIFGPSIVAGMFADDAHTIASGLQRELNTYFGDNNEWAVVNCSNHAAAEVWYVYDYLKSLPIKAGDVCIFHMDYPVILASGNEQIIDFNKIYSQPHNYGEVFIDVRHMSGKGYCSQGIELFKILQEGSWLDGKGVAEKAAVTSNTQQLTNSENEELQDYLNSLADYREKIGAIVMNCNPFTLGHRYLIEQSAAKVDKLYIFVVQEDKSFFKFADRFELVKRGTADLKNVIVVPSGKFIISQRTFEAYSNKSKLQDQVIDASMDVEIFATKIAPALGITIRFAGDEPLDKVTKQYNDTMSRILPQHGIDFEVITRKESGGAVISASRVRKYLEEKNFEAIKEIVPATTYDYLVEKYS